jgi:hypothetical protein
MGLQKNRRRSPLSAVAGQSHTPSAPRWRHLCISSGVYPRGQKPKGNRQRPYRRRSRSPSPPTISPNTALKSFGSISGTAETLTGLARRKPVS